MIRRALPSTWSLSLVVLALLASGCGNESAMSADPGLKILFESDADGDFDIYVMDSDGSNPTALTRDDGPDVDPCWSHDRSLIAFASSRGQPAGGTDIWIMNHDGSGPRRLTHMANARHPAWSPGDSLIAFVSGSGSGSDLEIIDVRDSRRRILTDNAVPDRDPAWTPDGLILFRSDRDGDGEIFSMNADGSNVVQLTHNETLDEEPTASRDGTRIFYVGLGDGRPEIFSMNRDGSDVVQLTSTGGARPCAGKRSDTVLFLRPSKEAAEAVLLNFDGSVQVTLRSGFAWKSGLSW